MAFETTNAGKARVRCYLKYDSIFFDPQKGTIDFWDDDIVVGTLKLKPLELGDTLTITNLKGKIEVT